MKIAFSGDIGTGRMKQLAIDVVNSWNGAFATPADTIDCVAEEPLPWQNSSVDEEEAIEEFGNLGAECYNRMMFLYNQYEKYKEEKNIVYSASPLDVMAETLTCFEQFPEEVKEAAVDKVAYWFSRTIQLLDLIYILAPKKEKDDDKEEKENKENKEEKANDEITFRNRYEQVLFGLWTQYTDNFEKSGIFPKDNCPGIALFETEEPLSELRLIIDRHGNLADDESPEKIQQLYDSIKDPRLLSNVKEILEKPKIPLIGVPQTGRIQL